MAAKTWMPRDIRYAESVKEKNTIEDHKVEIQLSPGTELTNLADIDLPSGDLNHALQLL